MGTDEKDASPTSSSSDSGANISNVVPKIQLIRNGEVITGTPMRGQDGKIIIGHPNTSVRFGRFNNAFEANGSLKGEFINADQNSFRINVIDTQTKGAIEAEWTTLFSNQNKVDQGATKITLDPDTIFGGTHVSKKALMLVNDFKDRNLSGSENQRIRVGPDMFSHILIEYHPKNPRIPSVKLIQPIFVKEEQFNIPIELFVFAFPNKKTGGDAERQFVVPPETAVDRFIEAQRIYDTCGIKLESKEFTINGSLSTDFRGSVTPTQIEKNGQKFTINVIEGTIDNVSSFMENIDTREINQIGRIFKNRDSRAPRVFFIKSFSPNVDPERHIPPFGATIADSNSLNFPWNPSAILSSFIAEKFSPFTVGHEIGHILMDKEKFFNSLIPPLLPDGGTLTKKVPINKGHFVSIPGGPPSIRNLMHDGSSENAPRDILGMKRIWFGQELDADGFDQFKSLIQEAINFAPNRNNLSLGF